jgi:subtilase family serine protease
MVTQGWSLDAASGDQGSVDGCSSALAVDFPASDPNIVAAGGGLIPGGGGTSIVAPELAGFFAQENAYLLTLGDACIRPDGSTTCAPIGNPNYAIYDEGVDRNAQHNPFYDITTGCSSNDITTKYSLEFFCAAAGYDLVTGWGSANMLQLAWAIDWEGAQANGAPSVGFTGPKKDSWRKRIAGTRPIRPSAGP